MEYSSEEIEKLKEAERKRAAYIALDMDEWTRGDDGKPRKKTLSEYAHDIADAITGKDEETYPLDSGNYQ